MDSLKKTVLIIVAVIGISFFLQGKSHEPGLIKAFSDSYSAEKKSNYNEAIQCLQKVYSDKSYQINLRLGWLYFSAKEYTKSLNYYSKAVELNPKSIEARLGYLKPATTLEMWDKVLEKYKEILKLDPNNTYAGYWTGMIYYNRGKFDSALKHFENVVNLYPFDADANLMAGWCNLKLGKKEEAKRFFQETLLIKPDNASALEGLKYVK